MFVCVRGMFTVASVVFFRAANVGGFQVFKPAVLAKELAEMDVVNIGAAGTFVVRTGTSAKEIAAAIAARVPFEPDLMICRAAAVLALAESEVFAGAPEDADPMLTVMRGKPTKAPRLPIEKPAEDWQVRLLTVTGPFVLSLRRPRQPGIYPNAVAEKEFGVPATTRKWSTVAAIVRALRS